MITIPACESSRLEITKSNSNSKLCCIMIDEIFAIMVAVAASSGQRHKMHLLYSQKCTSLLLFPSGFYLLVAQLMHCLLVMKPSLNVSSFK